MHQTHSWQKQRWCARTLYSNTVESSPAVPPVQPWQREQNNIIFVFYLDIILQLSVILREKGKLYFRHTFLYLSGSAECTLYIIISQGDELTNETLTYSDVTEYW